MGFTTSCMLRACCSANMQSAAPTQIEMPDKDSMLPATGSHRNALRAACSSLDDRNFPAHSDSREPPPMQKLGQQPHLVVDVALATTTPQQIGTLTAGLEQVRLIESEEEFEAKHAIGAELGRGAFSVVYAIDRAYASSAMPLAVKIIQKTTLSGPNSLALEAVVRRMRDECRVLAESVHAVLTCVPSPSPCPCPYTHTCPAFEPTASQRRDAHQVPSMDGLACIRLD